MRAHLLFFALLAGCQMTATSSRGAPPADGGSSAEPGGLVEACGNGYDDDDDRRVDEDCACTPGTTQRCSVTRPSLAGVGACALGTQTCEPAGEFGVWGSCVGAGFPDAEACNGVDDDCDGTVDDGCGECVQVPEVCDNGVDDDCDGLVDCDDVASCSAARACTGCHTEICGNGLDDDCDGAADCADTDCLTSPACDCLTSGQVRFDDVGVCHRTDGGERAGSWDYGCTSGCTCGGPWGKAYELDSRCGGSFRVCLRTESTRSGCVVAESCGPARIPEGGGSVRMPPLPGWTASGPCVTEMFSFGGRFCVRVQGTTLDGRRIDRELGCPRAWCGSETCSGTSSGPYDPDFGAAF